MSDFSCVLIFIGRGDTAAGERFTKEIIPHLSDFGYQTGVREHNYYSVHRSQRGAWSTSSGGTTCDFKPYSGMQYVNTGSGIQYNMRNIGSGTIVNHGMPLDGAVIAIDSNGNITWH